MSVATKRTVAELVQRSERLMRLAQELADEYGIDIAELNNTDDMSAITNGDGKQTVKRKTKKKASGGRMPRRAKELKKFIDSQGGAATRQQILHGTKIPAGTIGMLLTKFGEKRADGTWAWKKEIEKE